MEGPHEALIFRRLCVKVGEERGKNIACSGFHTGFFLGGGGGKLCMHPEQQPVIAALQCET